MIGRSGSGRATHVGIVMLPQFSMMSFSAALEPMRAANRLTGRQLYAWRLYSANGMAVSASNGIAVLPEEGIGDTAWPDIVLVCAGLEPHDHASGPVLAWLRKLSRHGVALGAISTGAVILARAGLLDGYRCTLHWENYESFVEEFPLAEVTHAVYEIDRDRLTCSGGTAALDMMLSIIAADHGPDLATGVSEQFIHDRIRLPADNQCNVENRILMRRSPKLADAVRMMAENVETPLSSLDIAKRLDLSLRQLERLFKKHKGCTPQQEYLAIRLRRARQLLLQTELSILEVSIATGFCSQSHFTRCYRTIYAITPTQHRLLGEFF